MLSLLALVVLGVAAAPTLAVPPAELAGLARYFPESTVMFAAIRTDDGYIDALNSVFGRVAALAGQSAPPDLREGLEQIFQAFDGGLSGVRAWIGDTAAVGLTSADMSAFMGSDVPVMGAISITDQAKADAAIQKVFNLAGDGSMYERIEDGDRIIYQQKPEISSVNTAYTLLPDAMIITPRLPFVMPDGALASDPDFADTLALLPEPDYNIIAYFDIKALVDFSMALNAQMGMQQPIVPQAFEGFMDALSAQVWGLTIRDDRTLVMDFAQPVNMAAFETSGMAFITDMPPVDPAFAAYIPADTPLVTQGTAFGSSFRLGLENLKLLGTLIQEQLRQMPESAFRSESERALRDVNWGQALSAFINLGFAGVTGLNLEKDVLPWMDGDYALYLRPLALPAELGTDATLDFAFVIQATDAQGPARLVSALSSAFDQYGISYTAEAVGEGQALALTAPIRLFFPEAVRARMGRTPEVDFLIGQNDDRFAIGSRKAVTFSLNPKGDNLADSAAYQEAWGYALEGSQTFAYLNTAAFVPFVDEIISRQDASTFRVRDLQDLKTLLNLFSSSSLSAVARDNSASVGRAVLTLAEPPATR
jgi:hypothetical protein